MLRFAKSVAKSLLPASIVDRVGLQRRIKSYGPTYLELKGWERSALARESIDAAGEPIPWITYPARMMIERVISKSHRVFEYGCGNSSLWWATRVSEVVSVEHDIKWVSRVAEKAPPNLRIILRPLNGQYIDDDCLVARFFERNPTLPLTGIPQVDLTHGLLSREFAAYALELTKYPAGYFDIVVVDGMARVLTTWVAIHRVNSRGFIVFDNSNRWHYNEAYDLLVSHGFKRIDFYGPVPVDTQESCTSIFARDLEFLSVNVCIPVGQKSEIDIW